MEITSATAGKMIKSLEEEKEFILEREKLTSTYILSVGETGEPPNYDYEQTQQMITSLDEKIAKLRRALHELRKKLPKQRMTPSVFGRYESMPSTPQYEYANYDIEKVEADYQETSSRIEAIQLDIDLVNQTFLFEVDLPS